MPTFAELQQAFRRVNPDPVLANLESREHTFRYGK